MFLKDGLSMAERTGGLEGRSNNLEGDGGGPD